MSHCFGLGALLCKLCELLELFAVDWGVKLWLLPAGIIVTFEELDRGCRMQIAQ